MRIVILFFCSVLSGYCMAAVVHSATVEIRNGFVLLQASVNGKPGIYLLDSGAPGLVLNSTRHSDTRRSKHESLSGVNGQINTTVITRWDFAWHNFSKKGNDAFAIDLSAIESVLGQNLDGLVGMDVFQDYYVLIDYATATLELWTVIPHEFTFHGTMELPLKMIGHIPVVTLTKDGRTLLFVLDTGSTVHLIDRRTLSKWDDDVLFSGEIYLVGGNQQLTRTQKIETQELLAQGVPLRSTSQFVITDLSEISVLAGTQIDGVLGSPVFSDCRILIDRERSYMRILSE